MMREATRREFLLASLAGIAASTAACADIFGPGEDARLKARPVVDPPNGPLAAGVHTLGPVANREALFLVPPNYDPARPAPLIVCLHGGGGDAQEGLAHLSGAAYAYGMLLLAPESRGRTWDVVQDRNYAYDVDVIDKSLRYIFDRHRIDRSAITLEGFSDGASYALGLGLSNGGLFTNVIAFSPGFLPETARQGKPRIFVSHGVNDDVLLIDGASRSIVGDLRDDDYDVTYEEFGGGHTIPTSIVTKAVQWMRASG